MGKPVLVIPITSVSTYLGIGTDSALDVLPALTLTFMLLLLPLLLLLLLLLLLFAKMSVREFERLRRPNISVRESARESERESERNPVGVVAREGFFSVVDHSLRPLLLTPVGVLAVCALLAK